MAETRRRLAALGRRNVVAFQTRNPLHRAHEGKRTASVSGTDVKTDYLDRGRALPVWLTRPEVAEILSRAHPPRDRQGFCIWLTGLSGAGKTTTADILAVKLLERGRQVTVLDGDVVRARGR